MDYLFYIASAVGALAVYFMMPSQRTSPRRLGALLGLLALAGTFGFLINQFDVDRLPHVYFYVFTGLAVICAVRVITHSRPVYSALFFVMVVLAVSGLFVVLEAEFMAFAMIIIYAGAILVTYLFVIMLATLPQVEGQEEQSPLYDRVAREPFSAVVLGFALIAVLCNVMFRADDLKPATTGEMAHLTLVHEMPGRAWPIIEAAAELPESLGPRTHELAAAPTEIWITEFGSEDIVAKVPLTDELKAELAAALGNIDRIGLTLFEGHPLGIELAGIILLLSMVGAIVIGRKNLILDASAPAPAPGSKDPQAA
jgi:NADH-quinone oxidoreductase subunit J